MKNLTKLLLLPLALMMTFTGIAGATSDRLTFFRIGTGPSTETLYGLGTAISAGISRPPGGAPCDEGGICGVPGLIAVAQSKTGSVENLLSLQTGELESALVFADMVYWSYMGRGPYRAIGPDDDLRVVANLSPVKAHIIVADQSPIRQMSDLEGKRISVGAPGSGIGHTAIALLKAHHLDISRISTTYMKPGPATDALAAGDIDALILFGQEPVAAIQDLNRRMDIRFLTIHDNPLRFMSRLYPFITKSSIAKDVYRGINDVQTVSLGVQWVVHKDADEKLVEQITRAFWQGQTRNLFRRNNPLSAFPNMETAVPHGWGAPLHPGARAYYDSVKQQ